MASYKSCKELRPWNIPGGKTLIRFPYRTLERHKPKHTSQYSVLKITSKSSTNSPATSFFCAYSSFCSNYSCRQQHGNIGDGTWHYAYTEAGAIFESTLLLCKTAFFLLIVYYRKTFHGVWETERDMISTNAIR